jgi:hypothetical protein
MATKGNNPLQGVARIWFRYLQLAIRAGEPIAWEKYEQWGMPDELATLTFNKWWKLHGADLFTPNPKEVKFIEMKDGMVVVGVPIGLKRDQILPQIAKVLAQHSPKGSFKNSLHYAPTGRVNTDALTRYQRMLEIELDPKRSGEPFKKKLDALVDKYRRNEARLKKQRATMQAEGKRPGSIKLPKTNKLRGKERDTENENVFPDIRVAHRWLIQAKIVMKNVASGSFPGDGYYQRSGKPSLGKTLRSK